MTVLQYIITVMRYSPFSTSKSESVDNEIDVMHVLVPNSLCPLFFYISLVLGNASKVATVTQ